MMSDTDESLEDWPDWYIKKVGTDASAQRKVEAITM